MKLLTPLSVLLLSSLPSSAVLTWTGTFPTTGTLATKFAALADLNNYTGDKAGLTEAFDDNNGADFSRNNFTTDVIFNNVNFGNINANIRNLPGNSLTLNNSQITLGGNAGFSTLNGTGPNASSVTFQGSSASVAAISNGLAASVDGTSTLTLRGASTPINASASVSLDPDGSITFTGNPANQGAPFVTNSAFPGSVASDGDTTEFSYTGDYPGNFNGNGTITALAPVVVPEPSTFFLLGLTAPLLLRRRR